MRISDWSADVCSSDLRAVGVGQQRVVERRAGDLLDVLAPALVVLDAVDRQADDLDVALVPLRLQGGYAPELGGADRRVVLGVREEDGPAVALPLVEVDGALGAVSGEVGSFVSQANEIGRASCRERVWKYVWVVGCA